MARPLQDGSRAAPTAAGPGIPAFPVGGTVALPPAARRPPPALPPRLNGIRRCGLRQISESRASDLLGSGWPRNQDEAAREPNGRLPHSIPSLEQAIGSRLRQMGDQFHHEHVQRQEPRPQGVLWGHLYHFVFQLLGVLNNLPVEGIVAAAAFRPN